MSWWRWLKVLVPVWLLAFVCLMCMQQATAEAITGATFAAWCAWLFSHATER